MKNITELLFVLNARGYLWFVPDKSWIKYMYKKTLHKKLNLNNPKTFNEKLQWLKINNRVPEFSKLVDKLEVKRYVAERIGEQYIIPTLGVWDTFEEIDFDMLPNQFVLKCTHDSGGLVICRNKKELDYENTKKRINKSLKKNYYYHGREWVYKNVKARIIAEEYLSNLGLNGLLDYKFYCFHGIPRFLYISEGLENHSTAHISFVNLDWTFAPYGRSDYEKFCKLPDKPSNFDKMIEIAKILSKGHKFIRVDLYNIDGKIYFSELTFFPCSGMMPFVSEQDDIELGKLLKL